LIRFRAKLFSRFLGVGFIGVAIGPSLGTGVLAIRHTTNTIEVFYVSVALSLINILLVCLVLPESLTASKRAELKARAESLQEAVRIKGIERERIRALAEELGDGSGKYMFGGGGPLRSLKRTAKSLLGPLALFLPYKKSSGGKAPRRDWNLTILAISLSLYLLTMVRFFSMQFPFSATKVDINLLPSKY